MPDDQQPPLTLLPEGVKNPVEIPENTQVLEHPGAGATDTLRHALGSSEESSGVTEELWTQWCYSN